MMRSIKRGSSRLKNYSADRAEHTRIAIGVLVWLLMGLIGLGMEILEFKLWLTYVM
ncbi:hypothetical protein D3C71_1550250 [compost metagenome]